MTTGNGDTPPAETVRPGAMPNMDRMSDRALLERACRHGHHSWETATTALEEVRELKRAVASGFGDASETQGRVLAAITRIEKRLGLVEARPREGSSPQQLEEFARVGVRFAELHLSDEDTAVRDRRLAVERKADMWSWVRKIAQVAVPAVALLVIAVLAAAKGWLE